MNPSHHFHLALIAVVLAYVVTLFALIGDDDGPQPVTKSTQPARPSKEINNNLTTQSSTTVPVRRKTIQASVPQSFLQDYDKYVTFQDYKAIALALDSDGTAAWAWHYRSDNQSSANEHALSECNKRRYENSTRSICKLFAVGESLVWDVQEDKSDMEESMAKRQTTPKPIADNLCNRSAECGNNICVKGKCRPMLSIGEECEYSGQCRAPGSCISGRCAPYLDKTVTRNAESDKPPSVPIQVPSSNQVKANSGVDRYVDSRGCLREADGSFVIGFRSDCK